MNLRCSIIMEWFCALALCLLVSSSPAASSSDPPEPILVPLNCNEADAQVGQAVDLVNEDRDEGFIFRPIRIESVYKQQVREVAGSSIYYINLNVIETPCSVLSGKKWKDCNEERPFHEMIYGECKIIYYISLPWRVQKLLNYNCTLTSPPASMIVQKCPDCPTILSEITPAIEEKAKRLVTEYNKASNQSNHFKLDDIERVRTQWVAGQSFYIAFTIKETDCVKTKAKLEINLDNCNSLKDREAHVGFCTGSAYNTPLKEEGFQVSCEIYEPRVDHHHHRHRHGNCDHGQAGDKAEQAQDNAGEAGASDVAQDKQEKSKDSHGKCPLDDHHHHHHRHGNCDHGQAGDKAEQAQDNAGEAGASDVAQDKQEKSKDSHGKCPLDDHHHHHHSHGHCDHGQAGDKAEQAQDNAGEAGASDVAQDKQEKSKDSHGKCPLDDHHHHHHSHGHCDHGQAGDKAEQAQDNAGEAGASDVAPDKKENSKDSHGKCQLDRSKPDEQQKGHKQHGCSDPHHHHHPGRHHHHHHHHHPDCHHHHHHHRTSAKEGSSSEEGTDQKPSEDRSKGSAKFYYNLDKERLPSPTISRLLPARRLPWKYVPKPADFPTEPSPLNTCPGGPMIDLPPGVKNHLFATDGETQTQQSS